MNDRARVGSAAGRRFGRRGLVRFVCAALLTWPASAPVSAQAVGGSQVVASGELRGVVRGRFGGRLERLDGAFVEVTTVDGVRATRSRPDGTYEVDGLPAGLALLRVTRVGHAPLELSVRVPAGDVLQLDLELNAAPISLPGVRVEAGRRQEADPTDQQAIPVPDPTFELRRLELSPGVIESGVLEAVMGMPGNDPADPSDVLFMRGSTTDMKLVLLDGMPVYAPFHVGGLLKSFEPSLLASADFHVGGAPARYNGGLTHVLDLQTRTARRDRPRASATVDLLSGGAVVEQPLGDAAGLLVSARTLHDAGTGLLGGGNTPYGYSDVLATFDADLGTIGSLRATGFRNRESVFLDFANGPGDATWGNDALTGTWRSRIGSAEVQATLGASRYDARLPLQPTPTEDDPTPSAILARADNERARLSVEAAWHDRGLPIRAGFSFEDQALAYAADRVDGTSRLGRGGSRSVLGGYVDGSRVVTSGVTLRAGLRADVFGGDGPRLAPRASMAVDVGPTALLTLAAGRYHQITRLPIDTGVDADLERFAEGGIDEALPVATADHVVLTLAQRPVESVALGIGGYFKRFSGIEAGGGTLQNSGLDLQVVGMGERGAVWLGYGLSWFWSDEPGSLTASDFAGRHLITLGLNGRVAGPFQVETRLSYGAGLPSTGIPFGSSSALDAEAPNGPAPGDQLGPEFSPGPDFLFDESFLRLDVELSTTVERAWAGHAWRVRPFLRLLNALDRRDALFYTYQPWRSDDITPLAVRPLLPIFGVTISY